MYIIIYFIIKGLFLQKVASLHQRGKIIRQTPIQIDTSKALDTNMSTMHTISEAVFKHKNHFFIKLVRIS